MLIVLEGCDGAGKTVLANKLAKLFSATIIHCSRHTPNTCEFFEDIIEASKTQNIIADRFCYGQFVYQSEEERSLTSGSLYWLETSMLAAGAKVVYVTADKEDIEDRLNLRLEVTSKPVKDILDGYESLFNNSMLPIITWDTSNDTSNF